jgi:dTDP-4-dehydrorhamnose reductase
VKILLTGSTGQVGWELQRTLATLGEVIVGGRMGGGSELAMDLAQPETIRSVIQAVRPTLIVNPAAYTAVDQAETEPELAMAINGTAPGIIAEAAHRIGAAMIHYSTDYVFNGTQAQPYSECDRPDPQNVYGQTKLAGELAIQAVGVPHLILRTSWVYGNRGKNFLLTMLKLAQTREELRVVADQIGAPTWSRLIAEATAQIVAQGLRQPPTHWPDWLTAHQGIYHLTATDQTSWYGFAKAIFAQTPTESRQLQRLLPIPTTEYPTPAARPAYSSLDTTKVCQTFGLRLPSWESSLALAIADRGA